MILSRTATEGTPSRGRRPYGSAFGASLSSSIWRDRFRSGHGPLRCPRTAPERGTAAHWPEAPCLRPRRVLAGWSVNSRSTTAKWIRAVSCTSSTSRASMIICMFSLRGTDGRSFSITCGGDVCPHFGPLPSLRRPRPGWATPRSTPSPAPAPGFAVDHRRAPRRNPDASRSRLTRTIDADSGGGAGRARSDRDGSIDSACQRRAGARAAPPARSPRGSRPGRGHSGGTPPPARGSARKGTTGLSAASTLSANAESAMDTECDAVQYCPPHSGRISAPRCGSAAAEQYFPVRPVVALCFTSARRVSSRHQSSRAATRPRRDRASAPLYTATRAPRA